MATATAAKPTARPMSKTEVVSGIAEETGLTKKQVNSVFEAMAGWKSACKRDPRRGVKIGIENGPTAVISVR